jgi:hypothetical protein
VIRTRILKKVIDIALPAFTKGTGEGCQGSNPQNFSARPHVAHIGCPPDRIGYHVIMWKT